MVISHVREFVLASMFATLLVGCASTPTVSIPERPVPATSPYPGKVQNESTKHWMERWELFRHAAIAHQKDKQPSADVVLLGDSMTERFPDASLPKGRRFENSGIGGDKIGGWKYYGLIDRLDVSVCVLEPRVVAVMIGVNDIVFAGTPRENMVENYGRLLREMHACAPDARVLLVSVLPVRTTNKTFNPQIVEFNATVQALAAEHGCEYVDLYPLFADEEGELKAEYAADTIHLNEKGYAVWAKKLEEVLATGG